MCKGLVLNLGGIFMLLIRPRLAGLHDLLPCLSCGWWHPGVIPLDGIHLDLLGEVASEKCRVDYKALYERRRTETYDSPVNMVFATGALRLPAIAHVLAPARQDEVVLSAEVLVTARHGYATVLGGGKVENGVLVVGEDGNGVAEEAEAGDASVRVHVEADVGVALLGGPGQLPGEALRGPALAHAEDGLPAAAGALPGKDLSVVEAEATLDGDEGRVVAGEEGRVNLDAVDGA